MIDDLIASEASRLGRAPFHRVRCEARISPFLADQSYIRTWGGGREVGNLKLQIPEYRSTRFT
eukprot:1137215-Prymnesium_polylepis.1